MQPHANAALLLLAAVLCVLLEVSAEPMPPAPAPSPARTTCDVGEQRPGCRIHVGMCVCGIGCRNEYQYADKEECTKATKGQRLNQCGGNPCQHGGTCSQTTMEPGYKCRCEGTGYYGLRCQIECPSPGAVAAGRPFPYECVVI